MTIQLYNTLSRQKEAFETLEPGVVRLYVCGVTVYASAHVGHAMSYLVFDALRRFLEYRGYRVRHVQNFTDVDDKIITKSVEEGVSAYEIADRYAREFLIELDHLGILPADIYPRVSSEMPSIVAMIQTLIDDEHAYAAGNGDVYFDASSAEGYGRLSGRSFEGAQSQEPPSAFKRDAVDFALWKSAKAGEPAWDSPWGPGRPGWHIECSAMASRHLGDQVDIHGGGEDLIFPHHENEIAQSEAACGHRPFARYWMHNGLLQLGDVKMSKSLGNTVSIKDYLAAHEPEALRLFVLSSHYRRPVTLSDDSIAAAEAGLARLRGALRPARPDAAGAGTEVEGAPERLSAAIATARAEFDRQLDDDFGTPGAIAALFELVTAINRARAAGVAGDNLSGAQAVLTDLAGVLGFRLREGYAAQAARSGGAGDIAPFVDLLIELRNSARAEKQWATSDRIRHRLAELGVQLEDAPAGTTWRLVEAVGE
jgi:cysteinyl-tRNA synthetase